MSFTTWIYPFFLVAVCLLYWRLPLKGRLWLLASTSLYFYACWDVRFISLIGATLCLDYACGRGIGLDPVRPRTFLAMALFPAAWLGIIQALALPAFPVASHLVAITAGVGLAFWALYTWASRRQGPSRATAYVWLSVSGNLAILAFFKYFNFFTDSAVQALQGLGFEAHPLTLQILLPVGISFYTFQSLSYVLDVRRGTTPVCRDFVAYTAYISFFPQLVAGPIERSGDLLPQILHPRKFDSWAFRGGCRLILTGFFKKIYVADNCAILANYAFDTSHPINALWAVIGALAFTFQIYGDFSGYSDIARGSARFFGIELNQNFRFPYFSTTPSDFWRRWHISLSSWFRDYVYIPMGGNRHGVSRTLLCLSATMLLAGLWHGASWTFVLWGAYHGALLIAYRVTPFLHGLDTATTLSIPKRCGAILVMFVLIVLGWVLFRSDSPGDVLRWASALGDWTLTGKPKQWFGPLWWLLLHIGPLLILQAVTARRNDEASFGDYPAPARVLIYIVLILLVVSSSRTEQEFIYFQF